MDNITTNVTVTEDEMDFVWRFTDHGTGTVDIDVGDKMPDEVVAAGQQKLYDTIGLSMAMKGMVLCGLAEPMRMLIGSLILKETEAGRA